MNKTIKKCKVDTDSKLSETNTSCKTEIQLLHDTVKTVSYTHLDVYKRQVNVSFTTFLE